MKLRSYNILFCIFSFLSDKTNGAPLFVKYKLLLGTLIIGLSGTAAQSQNKEITKDTIPSHIPDKTQITCYKPAMPPKHQNGKYDSIEVKGKVIDEHQEPVIAVSIRIKGNNNAIALTDINGLYNFKTEAKNILVFEFIGFEPVEIAASKIQENPTVIMKKIALSDSSNRTLISCYAVQVIKDPIEVIEPIKVDSIIKKTLHIAPGELSGIMCYGIVSKSYNNDDIYTPTPKEREFSYSQTNIEPVSPVGNLESFEKWVQSNIKYSKQMLNDKTEGEIILSFAINKKGKLVNKKVIKKLSKEADKEAIRVLSLSGKWKPGKLYGNSVKTTMEITIKFSREQ